MDRLSIRFRVDFGNGSALGPGKVALLEAIARTGSLSQAARDLPMSFRRGWLLLDSLNHSFRHRVAALSTGGRGGGGAALTPFGKSLVAAYRKLEGEVVRRARSILAIVARDTVRGTPAKVPRRRLQRPAPAKRRRPAGA
jgi:molybdate transport system regulatory protein